MRIVLDTNVLVSGLLSAHGPPGRLVDLVLRQDVTILYDDRILAEYRDVLKRPKFRFDAGDVNAVLDLIEDTGEPVLARPLPVLLPDQGDLAFLEVAAAGSADYLVSGNLRHYEPVKGSHDVQVVSPERFVSAFVRHG